MGTYCTTTSLQTFMVGHNFDTATSSLAGLCITWAENEVDKYLSKRYDVSAWSTSTSVPPMVTTWAEWLSLSYLWINLSRGGKESVDRGSIFRKMAIENLTAVSQYKLDLLDTAGSVITDMSNTAYRVLSSTDTYTETFAEDDPSKWVIDSDKLDDISDSRD